ncbi:sporulation and cell division repeat protein [gamma proteobacterium HTCC5015]|nr:sporulation and cell division repeat protein [gamma proteobacterium HTCC5015]
MLYANQDGFHKVEAEELSVMTFLLNRVFTLLLLLSAAFASSVSHAADVMSVEAFQYPAWLDSQGQTEPLRPGDAVRIGDNVRTGAGGKVWLTMADGARVKLGENASLSLERGAVEQKPAAAPAASTPEPASAQAQSRPVQFLRGAFNVVEGAFRYTSAKLETVWERQVDIGLGSVATIGIRGTDLWGQVGSDDQFVVLLEGDINVTPADGSAPTNMNKPLEIYKAQNNQKSTVDMAAVQALAPETELDFGTGVISLDGSQRLQLASYTQQRGANALVNRLATEGLAADVESATVNGQTWHRVVVTQLDSYGDARALAQRLPQDDAIGSPWVR